MSTSRLWMIFGLVAAVSMVGASGCRAEEAKYPTKPVNMVTYTAPGSPLDIYAREAARLAEKVLKVSIPVENRAGASGVTGLSHVKGQPVDGYTLSVNTISLTYVLAKPNSPVKVTDFDWFIRQIAEPTSLYVRSDSPIKTLQEFIDHAKANPGKLKISGPLTGGFHDAMMNKFSRLTGVKVNWVAFEGGNEAAIALLGGHVDASQMTPSSGLALIQEGKLRPLAVASDKRLDYLPNTPTYREQGVDMVDWLWRGIMVKKGTPPDVVKKLHDSFKQIMDTQEWKDYAKKNWQTEVYLNTEDFNKAVLKQTNEAGTYLKEIGVIK